MGRDTIAEILTSIRNAEMNKKGTVRIASTNITENIVKILLQEGFIENVRKHRENNKNFSKGMMIIRSCVIWTGSMYS